MNKLALLVAAAGVLVLTGCFNANVQVPEPPAFGAPPPATTIRPANANDRDDVIRENQELRARNAWLERQIADRQRKHETLRRDQDNIKADIARTQRERERYP